MKAIIYPYKVGSKSATALAKSLKTKKVFPNRNYRPRSNHVIINWGSSTVPDWIYQAQAAETTIINHPDRVAIAANKLYTFNRLEFCDVPHPEFTTDVEVAQQWWRERCPVVGRHKLTGHSGEGIETWGLSSDDAPIDAPIAPLYVKYIKKKHEYRVHVFNGEVIDVQQKRKRQEVDNEEVDYQVRNHHTGWVYCRGDLQEPDNLREIAIRAVSAVGLEFGAVDIIWNERQNQCYVLEVNTACGLEGTTLDNYISAIQRLL